MARALKQRDIASDRGPVDLETAVRGDVPLLEGSRHVVDERIQPVDRG